MPIISPEPLPARSFSAPLEAVDYITEIYNRNTGFIRQHLFALADGVVPPGKVRAFYPQAQVTSTSFRKSESTLPYGFLHSPGIYRTTLTAPDLFRNYLLENFTIILKNHGGEITVGESSIPIPLHFALNASDTLDGSALNELGIPLRDIFDAPDLNHTDDEIANGTFIPPQGGPYPLAAFTAPRVD